MTHLLSCHEVKPFNEYFNELICYQHIRILSAVFKHQVTKLSEHLPHTNNMLIRDNMESPIIPVQCGPMVILMSCPDRLLIWKNPFQLSTVIHMSYIRPLPSCGKSHIRDINKGPNLITAATNILIMNYSIYQILTDLMICLYLCPCRK